MTYENISISNFRLLAPRRPSISHIPLKIKNLLYQANKANKTPIHTAFTSRHIIPLGSPCITPPALHKALRHNIPNKSPIHTHIPQEHPNIHIQLLHQPPSHRLAGIWGFYSGFRGSGYV